MTLSTCRTDSGRTLAWAEWGEPEGVPVLQLHGTPGGRLGGAVMHEALARQGLRVITTDRAGYGCSDALPGRTVLDNAADCLAVLDAIGVERALVVGGSGGGPHALAVAVAAPDRVMAVGVLVGAVPLNEKEIGGQVAFNADVFGLLNEPKALRDKLIEGRETILGSGILGLLPDMPEEDRKLWEKRAEAAARVNTSALEPGIEGWYDDYVAIWGSPWSFTQDQVTTPVVWAHGTLDRNVPLSAARRYADQLPDCRFITWNDLGHAPGPEQFAEFYTALLGRALQASR